MKHVFIVGCPRSGSTWMTFLLAQHPSVATYQHAKLFHYLQWLQRWYRNKAGYSSIVLPGGDVAADGAGSSETRHLEDVLEEGEFLSSLRPVVESVHEHVASVRPGASVVVDKTPENAHLAELIVRVLPEASFLHVVRDPRSVFASHRSASKSWARWEFPTRAVDGARYWKRDVEASLRLRELGPNYLEVRYEDLKDQGPVELARILAWLGLESDPGFIERALAASTKDKVRPSEALPDGFVRTSAPRGWRDELGKSDVRVIEYLSGELMETLGYERSLPRARSMPLGIVLQDGGERTLGFLERKLRRAGQLMHWGWVGRKLEWPEP